MAAGVLLLTGPPGSGKTTTARLIARAATAGVHLEADSFFGFLSGGRIEPWRPESHPQNFTVMQAVAAAASAYADGGYTTVVDGIFSPRWFFGPVSEALTQEGHPVSYAILRPTLATCLARTAARSDVELSDPAVVSQLWNDFSAVSELGRHVVEGIDDVTPGQIADLVRSRWESGALRVLS